MQGAWPSRVVKHQRVERGPDRLDPGPGPDCSLNHHGHVGRHDTNHVPCTGTGSPPTDHPGSHHPKGSTWHAAADIASPDRGHHCAVGRRPCVRCTTLCVLCCSHHPWDCIPHTSVPRDLMCGYVYRCACFLEGRGSFPRRASFRIQTCIPDCLMADGLRCLHTDEEHRVPTICRQCIRFQ